MSYDDWQQHYSSFDVDSIVAEAASFETSVPVNRMSAFLTRLMDIACNDLSLRYEERLKAAILAITASKILLNIAGTERAPRATFDMHKEFSTYPSVAAAVKEGVFDEQNVVGLAMAKMEPHEIDLLQRLVDRGGTATISGNRDHRRFDQLEKGGYIERHAVAVDLI